MPRPVSRFSQNLFPLNCRLCRPSEEHSRCCSEPPPVTERQHFLLGRNPSPTPPPSPRDPSRASQHSSREFPRGDRGRDRAPWGMQAVAPAGPGWARRGPTSHVHTQLRLVSTAPADD